MGHGHDHDENDDASDDAQPEVTPKQYWEHTPSRRARPQYDPVEVARKYLDDMERGDRLHLKRKRS